MFIEENMKKITRLIVFLLLLATSLVTARASAAIQANNSTAGVEIVTNINPKTIVFDKGDSNAYGIVESMRMDTLLIGGQFFTLTSTTTFKDLLKSGDFVKVHYSLNPDGSYTIVEIELWNAAQVSIGSSN